MPLIVEHQHPFGPVYFICCSVMPSLCQKWVDSHLCMICTWDALMELLPPLTGGLLYVPFFNSFAWLISTLLEGYVKQ